MGYSRKDGDRWVNDGGMSVRELVLLKDWVWMLSWETFTPHSFDEISVAASPVRPVGRSG